MTKQPAKREPNVVTAVMYLKRRYAEISIRYPDFARQHTEGCTAKVTVPSGRTNDWGKEGICVPTA